MESLISLPLSVLGLSSLRESHVEDIVAQKHLVSALSQNLGNFFSVFNLPHIQIS